MKKYFSLILVLVLAFAMAVSAFAADPIQSSNGSANQNVEAEYTPGQNVAGKVYYVTVEWTPGGDLKYTDGDTTYTWNTNTLKYENGTKGNGTWSGSATVEVTVKNRSNDAIKATATWEKAASITAANCAFTNNGVAEVKSAAENVEIGSEQEGTEQSGTITATITGVAGTISETNKQVGSITVTIAPQA